MGVSLTRKTVVFPFSVFFTYAPTVRAAARKKNDKGAAKKKEG